MKKYIILISSIILSVSLTAQNPFNKLFGFQLEDEAQYLYKINDSIFSLTLVNTLPNNNFKSSVVLINQNLDSINSITFLSSNLSNDFWASGYKYNNGIYFTSGMYWLSNNNINVYLKVFDNNGNDIINKSFGGVNTDIGLDITLLQDSGYIIVGSTESFGAGGEDIYIIRTDKFGDTIWTKTYGRADRQVASLIVNENDSTFVIAGKYANTTVAKSGPFMMKINLNGDTTKVVYNAFTDELNSLIKINNNEFIIAGRNWDSQNYPAALMKLDNNFNVIWSKQFRDYAEALDVKQTSDNGYIMVGYCKNNGDDDIYVVKTDANGDTLWTKEIGGPLSDVAYSVIEAPDSSGYVIAGYTHSYGNGGSDAFLLKLKPNGDLTTSIGLEISPKYLEAKVFPNPTSDEFNLKIDNYSGELQMQIIDISGKSIYKENLNVDYNFQKSFKLKNLPSGVYSISLKGDDFEKALKLVVE